MEGFGRPHAANSASGNRTSSSPNAAGICEVIATTTKSGRVSFNLRGEMTSAGRCLIAVRSVNGNGTSTMSPWLKLVVDGILGIVPEFERRLRRFQPRNIVRLDFQMRRQVLKQTDLLTNIQMFNRFADLVDIAHHLFINQASGIFHFCFAVIRPLNHEPYKGEEFASGTDAFQHSCRFVVSPENKNPAGRFRRGFELIKLNEPASLLSQ